MGHYSQGTREMLWGSVFAEVLSETQPKQLCPSPGVEACREPWEQRKGWERIPEPPGDVQESRVEVEAGGDVVCAGSAEKSRSLRRELGKRLSLRKRRLVGLF